MFETVAPARASRANRNALYEALTFSLVVHGLAAAVAVGSNLWQVTFPTTSPAYTIAFVLEAPPPPPPPPPPARPPEQKPEITTAKMLMSADVLAPTVIPDEIPNVKPQTMPLNMLASAKGIVGGIDSGIDQGIVGGIAEGDVGGKIGGTIGGVVNDIPDGRVHIARDKKLPMIPMSQVYPSYPEDARMRAWEDELVVRYVIGKDGRVKEATIVSAPQRPVFVDGTLRAIRSWRFKPMIKDGEKTEVVHELTVYFRLNQT
ncbi:MAG TPA: TonB family protein [Thermoanaerobaculia bacterium]